MSVQACEAANADTAGAREEAERLRGACKAADAECAQMRRKLKNMAEALEGANRAKRAFCAMNPER